MNIYEECFSVGALLYCPANNSSIVDALINNKLGNKFSIALCLEDSIADNTIFKAQQILINSIRKIFAESFRKNFFLPKIFIRVRNPEQITYLFNSLKEESEIISGFIFPKFSLDNADEYIKKVMEANEVAHKKIYMMPILESPSMINLSQRYNILYELKYKLDKVYDYVLNIRVGGNDLCNNFGFRRHSDQSIHKIAPIESIFSDIISVFGLTYVISGPVWEYYNGYNWLEGLKSELEDDKLCGFIGKTAIHPKQIPVINEAYMIIKKDFDDAKAILNWNKNKEELVCASVSHERMNEYKTHINWAEKIICLSNIYGIKS